MSAAAVSNSNSNSSNNNTRANQDRPLLHPSPLPSDQPGRRIRTLLDLLNVEKMDGLDHRSMLQSDGSRGAALSKWRILKERLGLRIVGCCGVATWRNTFLQFPDDDNNTQNDLITIYTTNHPQEINHQNEELLLSATRDQNETRTNLATALAAEREYRPTEPPSGNTTPSRVSLMRLLEETTDGDDPERKAKEDEEEDDGVCCVCMGRKKGAAFIPCGHTYCRVCSRELWLNRGSCPLCNQRILEILDIF